MLEALGDDFCSIAQHAYEDERGLFKRVNCERASKSSVLDMQSLIEKGIMPHGLISTPAELGNVAEIVERDDGGTTWDNSSSSSQTITTVVDGGFDVPNHPRNTFYLLIRTQIECIKPPERKLPKPHPSFINNWQEQYPFLLHLMAGRQEVIRNHILDDIE